MSDLYAILGVDRSATADEIKRAYRAKARELHPDTGGDEEAFKEAQHAYQVLSDPERRARYDRFGDDGRSGSGAATGDPFGFGQGFGGLGEVIDAFFGGFGGGQSRRASGDQPGRDVLVRMRIDLEDVATGMTRPVSVDVAATCGSCAGVGSTSGGGPVACGTCGGAGQVQRLVRTAFGQLASAVACPECDGTGRTVVDPCDTCGGEGRHAQKRTITIEIPRGVADGDRLRVGGAGEAGRLGAPAGDLYVEIQVDPHEVYERDGRDLRCEVTIPLTNAALGADLTIPSITGDALPLHVPPGTQPGDVLTLRGAGLPARGGLGTGVGDLHVQVQVDVPRKLTTEERELLERFAELRGDDIAPAGRSLFSRLREAFR